MPLRLNVGVSRKIGLPEFCSVGASCNIEVELDSGLLRDDLDGLHAQVQGAFVAAQQAVNDELARLLAAPAPPVVIPAATPANGHARRNGSAAGPPARLAGSRGQTGKPATPGQVKAIYAIARSQQVDLDGLLRDDHGVERPEDLSLAQASQLIDQLKAAGAD
jgi:hypothetical protein